MLLHRGPEAEADPHCFMQSLSYCTGAQGLKLALTTFFANNILLEQCHALHVYLHIAYSCCVAVVVEMEAEIGL